MDKENKTLSVEERFRDPWNILSSNGKLEDGKERENCYHYHTKEEWWKRMAAGFADGGNCEDLFFPIVTADCNILRTNLLKVFDDICDTKEHTDDFFRCHPSADYINKNTYLIRSMIHGYGTPKYIQDMRSDAWFLCCEKMDELVKKWYGVEKWGEQKVPNREFKPENLSPLSWKDKKFFKVFVNEEFNERIEQPIPVPDVLKGSYVSEQYIVDRPVYVAKKKSSSNSVFIGYCRSVQYDSLVCGHIRKYDEEDRRYYTNSISFNTVRIVFHENTKTIINKLRKDIGNKDIGVKFHLMTQYADNGDGWHILGGSDEAVSKNNNTIFFAGTGRCVRDDGLHINNENKKWKERVMVYPDKVVIINCSVPENQALDFEDETRQRRCESYFT